MFSQFQREIEAHIDQAVSLAWFMRGSIQYHDVFDLTPYERERMSRFLNERLEKEFKKANPVY